MRSDFHSNVKHLATCLIRPLICSITCLAIAIFPRKKSLFEREIEHKGHIHDFSEQNVAFLVLIFVASPFLWSMMV